MLAGGEVVVGEAGRAAGGCLLAAQTVGCAVVADSRNVDLVVRAQQRVEMYKGCNRYLKHRYYD